MKNSNPPKISEFTQGNENIEYERFFSGKSWLKQLTSLKELNVPLFNVTFEPSCRNNWHTHSGGQILIAIGGKGLYQERGKKAQLMMPGDIIEIAPNLEHWHGAAPHDWFSHLAITCNPQNNQNIWMEPVSNEDYQQAFNSTNK